ncbi:MAG: hypothetical protein UV09_C0017G0032 [Candidatus Gottesmanbacteria bacterium GW2011_GWA2_42_18]|uniref:Uncharacterized protein n=1 Tax=Candidatus Gottesmanbacteria bacterium GW2011_GWA2_42_18 TaxID=1618442 RepID=A0A0G0ZCP5_9BACT|nr:MAG: hypothetical protein UV09_C0017G0032 [Candidatus Gottesmanbacteria bacterium GW2011_GWA2_42_18]KKS75778.1 MAG: hypothetical protein UV46_C0013G0020 [Candidatus Gottesmanbacteria bacterium GW2011_GWC2_42_8]
MTGQGFLSGYIKLSHYAPADAKAMAGKKASRDQFQLPRINRCVVIDSTAGGYGTTRESESDLLK